MSRQPFWARSTRPCQHVNKSYKQWQMTNVNYIIAAQWSYSNSFANGRSSTIAGKLRNVKLDSSIVKSAHFWTCSPGTTRTILQKKFKNPSRVSLDELGFGHLRPEILVDSCGQFGHQLLKVQTWWNAASRNGTTSAPDHHLKAVSLQTAIGPSFSLPSLPASPCTSLCLLHTRSTNYFAYLSAVITAYIYIYKYTQSHTYHLYISTVLYIHICMHAFVIPTYLHIYVHTHGTYVHTYRRTYIRRQRTTFLDADIRHYPYISLSEPVTTCRYVNIEQEAGLQIWSFT